MTRASQRRKRENRRNGSGTHVERQCRAGVRQRRRRARSGVRARRGAGKSRSWREPRSCDAPRRGRVAPGAPEGGHTPRALGEEKERRDPETGVSDPSRTPVGKVAPFDRPAAGLLPSSLTTGRSGGRPQPAHDRLSPPLLSRLFSSLFPTSGEQQGSLYASSASSCLMFPTLSSGSEQFGGNGAGGKPPEAPWRGRLRNGKLLTSNGRGSRKGGANTRRARNTRGAPLCGAALEGQAFVPRNESNAATFLRLMRVRASCTTGGVLVVTSRGVS